MWSFGSKQRATLGQVFITLAVAVGTLFGIPILKIALTGSSGPQTAFFSTIVAAPIAFLILGAVRSRRMGVAHLGVLAAGAGILWLRYPSAPMMDFQRQITHMALPVVWTLYLVGCLLAAVQHLRPGDRPLTS